MPDTTFLMAILLPSRLIKLKLATIKMRQTRLPVNWIVEAEESSSSSSELEEEVGHRRNAQPLQWTRVKSLELIKDQRLMVYNGTNDLSWDKTLKVIRKQTDVHGGEFVFDPDSLKEEAKTFRLETSRLAHQELIEYGRLATDLRAGLKARAVAAQLKARGPVDRQELELPASVL